MPTIGDIHPAGPGRRGPWPVRPAPLAGDAERGPEAAVRRGFPPPSASPAAEATPPSVARAGFACPRPAPLVAGIVCALTAVTAASAGAQTPPPTEEADGLVHAALVLEGQEIGVAFPPDLHASGPAYAELLAGAAVRLGTFEGHRALRMGTLAPDLEALAAERAAAAARVAAEAQRAAAQAEPDEDDAAEESDEAAPEPAEPPDPELWLARDAEGWRLEIRTADVAGSDGGTVHVVPLQHREAAAPAPVFTASVHATAAETGRLELRWGRQAWSSDFRFDELPPPPRRPRVSGRGTPRQAADDNTPTARNNMLNERNETALVLPDGARISMLYWKGIDVEDEDYPRVADTPDGAVVEMIRAPALRLKSDVSLRFGEADVPTGNLAPGFAGAYGVWLRRAGAGWRFVFNHEPDSWGTQHDPDFDAAETPVEYSRAAGSFRPLGATLVPAGPDEGRLVVHWGPHEWAADFTVVRGAADQ